MNGVARRRLLQLQSKYESIAQQLEFERQLNAGRFPEEVDAAMRLAFSALRKLVLELGRHDRAP